MDDPPFRPDATRPESPSTPEPAPSMPKGQAPWLRRRWWVLLLVVVVGGVIAAQLVTSSDSDPGSSAFHQSHLAEHETESLAALLVDVPSHSYQDATASEIANALAQIDPEVVPGLSIHSVRDSEDREVAFLQLWEFVPGTVPEVLTVDDASQLSAGEATAVTVGDYDLILLDDAEHPDSRYKYMWVRGDVLLVADGGDKERLAAWLDDYLSTLDEAS